MQREWRPAPRQWSSMQKAVDWMDWGRRVTDSKPWSFVLAAGIATLAFLVRYWGMPWMGNRFPFLLSVVGVLLTAGPLGLWHGVLAAALGILLPATFILPPVISPLIADPIEALAAAFTFGANLLVASTIHALALSRERERVLLSELRHRTHNEMQQLMAEVYMIKATAKTEGEKAIAKAVASRIRSIAAVYGALSETMESPYTPVDSDSFLRRLCGKLMDNILSPLAGVLGSRINRIECDVESHRLSQAVAISLGVILNELAAGALRSVFPISGGVIWVRFHRGGEDFILTVEDNGFSPDVSVPRLDGVSRRIATGLAKKLGGNLDGCQADPGAGMRCVMRFPAERAA